MKFNKVLFSSISFLLPYVCLCPSMSRVFCPVCNQQKGLTCGLFHTGPVFDLDPTASRHSPGLPVPAVTGSWSRAVPPSEPAVAFFKYPRISMGISEMDKVHLIIKKFPLILVVQNEEKTKKSQITAFTFKFTTNPKVSWNPNCREGKEKSPSCTPPLLKSPY